MSRVGYPLWVAMGAAVFGTLLGGAAVYLGLTGSVDPYLSSVGLLPDGPGRADTPPEIVPPPAAPVVPESPAPAAETLEEDAERPLLALADAVATTRSTVVTLKVGERLNGAGVIFDEDGYVFTNFHVVEPLLRRVPLAQEEPELTVIARFVNGRELPAKVVAADGAEDIAILRLMPADSAERFEAAAIGESSALRVGDSVFAVGSPVGLEHTVSTGIVSAMDRTGILANRQLGLLQLDASINVGNSGGPLFNLRGELVGITAARSSKAEGIGFAIPIDRIRVFLDTLRTGSYRRAGVVGLEVNPNKPVSDRLTGSGYTTGVLVNRVLDGSAERAGLKVGDVIVAIKGRRFDELGTDAAGRAEIGRRIVTTVRAQLPGEKVPLTVVRDGKSREIAVEVEAANDRRQVLINAERLLGLRFVETAAQGRRSPDDPEGLEIVSVVGGSPVSEAPWARKLAGMRLVQIANIKIDDVDDLGRVLPDVEALTRSGRARQLSLVFRTPTGELRTAPGYPLGSPE